MSERSPAEGRSDCGSGCEEFVLRIVAYLDNELDEADCGPVRHHLAECPPCHEEADLERLVKQLLARSCGESAPEGLRDRVLWEIRQVTVQFQERSEG